MTDIDLSGLPDHDLLVVAVTKINAVDEKLESFCVRVETLQIAHARLQAEHDVRVAQSDCPVQAPGVSRKTVATSAGLGGIVGAIITSVIDYFLRRG